MNCELCGKRASWFKVWTNFDGLRCCKGCLDAWPDVQKTLALKLLCQGGEPHQLFHVAAVATEHVFDSAKQLFGEIVATDVALVFVAFGVRAKDAYGTATALFGLIGATVESMRQDRLAKKEHREYAENSEFLRNRTLSDIIHSAHGVHFRPKASIKRRLHDARTVSVPSYVVDEEFRRIVVLLKEDISHVSVFKDTIEIHAVEDVLSFAYKGDDSMQIALESAFSNYLHGALAG